MFIFLCTPHFFLKNTISLGNHFVCLYWISIISSVSGRVLSGSIKIPRLDNKSFKSHIVGLVQFLTVCGRNSVLNTCQNSSPHLGSVLCRERLVRVFSEDILVCYEFLLVYYGVYIYRVISMVGVQYLSYLFKVLRHYRILFICFLIIRSVTNILFGTWWSKWSCPQYFHQVSFLQRFLWRWRVSSSIYRSNAGWFLLRSIFTVISILSWP